MGEKIEVVKKFLQKMCDSGYDKNTRGEVVKSAVRKHHRQLKEAKSNSTSIYSSRKEINMRKETCKLLICPWLKQMRGGNKIKEVKEGKIRKTSKRCEGNLENLEIERGELKMGDMKNKDKVKEIEGVVFAQYTHGSKLKNSPQFQDEMLAVALQAPSLRFVERSRTTIVQDVGQSDPWASDMFCQRKECWHSGKGPVTKRGRGEVNIKGNLGEDTYKPIRRFKVIPARLHNRGNKLCPRVQHLQGQGSQEAILGIK